MITAAALTAGRGDRQLPSAPTSCPGRATPDGHPLGVCAGTADVTAGVFSAWSPPARRSRSSWPASRLLLAPSVAFTLAGYVVSVAGPALLAGHPPASPVGPIVSACAAFLLGLGLSSICARIWRTVSRDA
jgi:hypothetical protein